MPIVADIGATDLAAQARDLALLPDALHWAGTCGWVPGTGYCHNRQCGVACPFAPHCGAEARRAVRSRRERRLPRRPGADRVSRR